MSFRHRHHHLTLPPPVPTPVAPAPVLPLNQLIWKTPEGGTIELNTAIYHWTTDYIYSLLQNAGLNAEIGANYHVVVQDSYGSQTSTSAGTGADGRYDNFHATTYLLGVNTTLDTQPHSLVTHEYGHAFTLYHHYITEQGDWTPYLTARGLLGNQFLDTNYPWSRLEIMAEDYRLLYGSEQAINENPGHMNYLIPDPRGLPELRAFMDGWRAA